jgi:ABC-type Na+ transport system ATPase subunit NatA
MTNSTRLVTVIATLLSALSGSAFAASRTDTSTTPANLRIQVNVVQVIMTNPDPQANQKERLATTSLLLNRA